MSDWMGSDGYPTEASLSRIREWPVVRFADAEACMDFAGSLWTYPDYWKKDADWPDPDWPNRPTSLVRYVFSTGGWSGNESIVAAIEANQMVQMMGAWSWRRGGNYEYRFPKGPTGGVLVSSIRERDAKARLGSDVQARIDRRALLEAGDALAEAAQSGHQPPHPVQRGLFDCTCRTPDCPVRPALARWREVTG